MHNESVFSPDLRGGLRPYRDDQLRQGNATRYEDTTMSTTDWNVFHDEHQELSDQGLRSRAQTELEIRALELVATEIQATDVDAADEFREEIRRLKFEIAEPYAVEITLLIDKLDAISPSDPERTAILDRIAKLEAEFRHIITYDPYVAGTTPFERRQTHGARVMSAADQLDIYR